MDQIEKEITKEELKNWNKKNLIEFILLQKEDCKEYIEKIKGLKKRLGINKPMTTNL